MKQTGCSAGQEHRANSFCWGKLSGALKPIFGPCDQLPPCCGGCLSGCAWGDEAAKISECNSFGFDPGFARDSLVLKTRKCCASNTPFIEIEGSVRCRIGLF